MHPAQPRFARPGGVHNKQLKFSSYYEYSHLFPPNTISNTFETIPIPSAMSTMMLPVVST